MASTSKQISKSFHQNIFLLNQLVSPTDDFKKHFREDMFDKPNTAGFIHVSHYLLTIYDAERFAKQVEWPVVCKRTEAKYRNDVKNYVNMISLENPDIGLPHVLATYLHRTCGTKFTIIMWKLSQLILRKYITSQGDHEVIFMPKLGPTSDLTRTYLQQSKADITSNMSSRHRNCVQMEKATNFALAKEEEELAKIKTEIFDKKQSIVKLASTAPVDASVKQRLTNVEDTEIIQMWKENSSKSVSYIQKQYVILNDLENVCKSINGIISNILNDEVKPMDVKQLKKINCTQISELSFPSDVQHCLYNLYNDHRLVYHNFIYLLTSILRQMYQYLEKGILIDLSQCLLQIEGSTKDMKSMCNVLKTFLTNMVNSIEEIQSALNNKNARRIYGENVLPLVKSVLLVQSPIIKINTDCTNDTNNLHKLLQFTPGEVTHKSLFSRYVRNKQSQAPDLRTDLFVSRISIDDATSLGNNEKHNLYMRFATPKVNRCKRTTGKYSRLFSICMNKNIKANCSMISLPSSAQAHSSAIASIEEMPSLSDINLDITGQDFFNTSEESLLSIQLTPIKQEVSRDTSEETKDTFTRTSKVNKPELDELTEVQFGNNGNQGLVVKHENASRRRSIGDLVERYKKLLEAVNSATTKLEDEDAEYKTD